MKNLKLFLVISLLTGTVFSLVHCSSNESSPIALEKNIEYRNISSCMEDYGLSPFCDSTTITINVSLPSYPNCSFEIQFFFWECNISNYEVVYHVSDPQIVNQYCSQYNTDLQNAMNNGTIESFNLNIYRQVWQKVNSWLLNNTSPTKTVVEMDHYVASCSKMCYWISRNGGWVGWKYPCGENCCKLFMYYKNINGIWVLDKKEYIPVDDPCSGSRPVNCLAGKGKYETECTPQCEVLDF